MMESGFSSPRSDAFPAGLRVLVVDDDPTWLKILEKMLKKCSYEVITCGQAWDALKLLRDRKDGFDIVISDVNMPDMDGFKLLEHVGLEMDLPVIMMSVDGETSRVMKGVHHGACDYLLKPIRMKELKNIWQHVVRKRMHEMKDIEYMEDRNGSDPSNDAYYSGDHTSFRKRKDADNNHDEKESTDSASTKKARVVWTVELHQKFVKAVNQIGIDSDKVGPKKILDLMNVPRLTRENVASHLQKYRLYLSRIRKGDKIDSCFGGMKNSESTGSCTLPNSTFMQQNDVNGDQVYPGKQQSVGIIDSKFLDTDLKSSSLLPLTEQKPSNNENSDTHKASTSQVGLKHAFGSLGTSIETASFDSSVSGQYPWIAEAPDMQFESEFKPHSSLEYCFIQPTLSIVQHHNQPDLLDPAPHINPGPSISDSDLIDIKPSNVKPGGNDIKQLSPIEGALGSFSVSNPEPFGCVFDMALNMKNQNSSQGNTSNNEAVPQERSIQSFPLHPTSHFSNEQGLDCNFDVTSDMNNQSCDQGSIILQGSVVGLESDQRSQLLGNESAFGLPGEDLKFYWLQCGDTLLKDVEFDYVGFSDLTFPEHACEVPVPRLGIDYDPYPFDCVEYPVDQGLLFS